mgnify:CR=1 FL=1
MNDALTIIIPTYNRCDLLGECLTSLEAQPGVPIKVLVMDDGSEEDVTAYVRENFMGVEVMRSEKNQGFATTVNAGLRTVTSEYVMLLNNDMTLEPDCIERMMKSMHDQAVDMITPLIVWKDDPETIYSAGDFIRVNGRPESYGYRAPRREVVMPESIFGVTAGAAIYKKKLFDEVGDFDEKFVAYFEDADWCFRARLAGFTAGLAPLAVARHVGSASQNGMTWWRSRQCFRNHALLVIKNMPWSLMFKHLIAIKLEYLHQSRRTISSARTEFGLVKALGVWAKALLEVLALYPYAFYARRGIQKNRKLSPAEVERLLTP